MLTPLVLLVLMTAPYLISRLLKTAAQRDIDLRGAGAIGLTLLFILTGIGHFTETEAMARMLPSWIPGRVAIVYLTGVLELTIAAGFFFRKTRRITGWIATTILVLFFPANVYAAIHQVPMGGHAFGPVYLLIRAPLQLIILAWVYWFTIREIARRHSN
jgi:uncharacterized membrane protein